MSFLSKGMCFFFPQKSDDVFFCQKRDVFISAHVQPTQVLLAYRCIILYIYIKNQRLRLQCRLSVAFSILRLLETQTNETET